MSLQQLFDQYLKAGLYLKGWSPKTAIVSVAAFEMGLMSAKLLRSPVHSVLPRGERDVLAVRAPALPAGEPDEPSIARIWSSLNLLRFICPPLNGGLPF
jgi:hypothetical protein